MTTVRGVCVDEGWFKQPHLARVRLDYTLGMGEAAQLLYLEQSMCTGQTSRHHTYLEKSPASYDSMDRRLMRCCLSNWFPTSQPCSLVREEPS